MRIPLLLAALLLAGCASAPGGTTTVTTTETLTLLTSDDGRGDDRPPSIAFSRRDATSGPGGTLTVVAVQPGSAGRVDWSELRIRDDQDAQRCTKPAGTVDAGDVVQCSTDGPHTITYLPGATVLYRATFHS